MDAETPPSNPLLYVWRLSHLSETLVEGAVDGMTAADFGLYSVLRYGAPLTPSELARASGTPPSTLSQQVRRIAERGHLEEGPNPDDGRSRLLGLTAAGVAAHERGGAGFRDLLGQLREELGAGYQALVDQLATLDDALAAVLRRRAAGDTAPRTPLAEQGGDEHPLTAAQRRELADHAAWLRWRDGHR